MSDLFEPIAVVGIAGRLPGARDVDEFWQNLVSGRECLSALTDEELLAGGVPRQQLGDPSYVKRAGMVPGLDMFDPAFFNMTPREAEVCDPQQRLFLEMTYQAIENAGYDPAGIGRDVAVYGASGPARYGDIHVLANPRYGAAGDLFGLSVLNNVDYLTTLASYKLDLRGPSMAVLTACSGSLAAMLLACRSLQLGECDAAVAGAAHAVMPYRVGYRWSPGDVRSPDGYCRPFDAAATGTVFTSGAGAVLLKRLSDATADGDHVWGVIHGIGANNDGADKVSFSAPSMSGVTNAIVDGMAMAGFGPEDIDCVEMHATGTPMGDPIEVKALAEAYRRLDGSPADGSIPVGSVKSNIGHAAAVAGMAGLLKLVLALRHEQLPPTINVTRANPRLEIERTPLLINDTLRPWPRTATRTRRAGLTSLGIGGTNFHLILEEGTAPAFTPHQDRPRIVVWSGKDAAARDASQAALAGYFGRAGEVEFADAVATLQRGRAAHPARGAAVCTSAQEAAGSLSADGRVLTGQVTDADPPGLVFTFPGQGAQHARMAAGLYGTHHVFTETVDICFDVLERQDLELYPLWLADTPGDELYETANAQPLLFAIEYALAQQWIAWGIRPYGVLGHSVGELVAATVAGVMDLEDALRLVVLRGQAMQRRPRGSMLVAAAAPDRLASVVPGDSGVTVAAVNAAEQVVLAGAAEDVATAAQALAAAGIATQPLRTSHAFHSPAMAPAVAEFLAGFTDVRLRPPAVPVYSAATGKRLTDEQACDPEFWARQLADPVLFADAVGAATDDVEGRILLEVGPGRTLSGLVQRHPAVAGRWRCLASLPRPGSHPDPRSEERTLLNTLAELWLSGCPVDWSQVYRDETPQRVPVPGYQFQRERYWVEPVTGPAAPHSDRGPEGEVRTDAARSGPGDAPAVAEPGGPFTVPGWIEAPLPASADEPAPAGTVLALVPADRAEALPYVNALQQASHRVVRVRPGDGPARRAGEFVVRPSHLAEDLDWVLGRLAADDCLPSMLVHAWGTGGGNTGRGAPVAVDDELDLTFFALLDLVQTAARRPVDGRLPSLFVLTSGAVDVSGGEVVAPARAALVAAARTYGMESPGTVCRVIDTGAVCSEDQLVAELVVGATDRLVALRGTRRWLPTQREWPAPAARPVIRRGGVYLLTGGLGGLGLAVAKGLAATGRRPKLALLARSARDVSEDVAEIESMGAEVRVVTCDVADQSHLGKALDEVTEAFGPVNGVLHLAGVAGGGMLQFRGRTDARQVLRPKVHGALALADVLADRPPVDFVVCFSSRAALTGMVGSGDYAAANAFLDAFAAGRAGWLSVNWPAWSTVGMAAGGVLDELTAAVRAATSPEAAAPSGVPADPGPHYETVLSASTHWELDEHRIGDAAVLPGTGIVDLILRALPEVVPDATGPVTLRDVTFLRPLVADSPRRVGVHVEPAGARTWRVGVRSHPAGPADTDRDWQEHATCELTVGAPATPTVAVDELTAGLPEVPPPSMLPTPESTIVFGPRWRCVERLWESSEVTVAELAVPALFADEAGGYLAHPALLDVGTGLLRRRAPADLLVPFLYEKASWYAPLPGRVYCRLRRRPGEDLMADVEVIAPDGTVVMTVEGFRLRSPRLTELTGQRSDSQAAGGEPNGGQPDGSDTGGLSPEDGVRLLLRLVETTTPAQVAVLPHRYGSPVAPEEPVTPAPPPERTPVEEVAVPAAGAAADSVRDRLAGLWQQVLGRPGIQPEDDFFALGGDSLMGVALVGRIRDAFGVEVSIGSLFESPTLGELTAVLVEQGAPMSDPSSQGR